MAERNWDAYKERQKLCCCTYSLLQLKQSCDANQIASNPKFKIVANRCKTKICPRCGGIRVSEIRKSLKAAFLQEKLRSFTFDIQPSGNVFDDLHAIEKYWSLVYKRLRRKYPYLRYFKVMEIRDETNMVHIHGLWNIYIKWEELRKIWFDVAGSNCLWLTAVHSYKGSVGYLLKYIKKSFCNPRTVKYFYEGFKRQYSYSSKDVLEKRKKAIYDLYDFCQRSKEKMIDLVGWLLWQTNNYNISDFQCKEIENFHSLAKLEEANYNIRDGPSPLKNLFKVEEEKISNQYEFPW